MAKLPRNYRISSEVDQLLKAESARLTIEQGKKVSEADVIEFAVVKWCSNGDVNTPVNTTPERQVLEDAPLDNRPKNAYCKHCGARFAGQRFATICPSCKRSGHTNQPANCPRCTEGMGI
jgi:Zn finger protein HypA/HybF involved in hydrogenase expression